MRLAGVTFFIAALLAAPLFAATRAEAGLQVCNDSSSRVGVALGYHDGTEWVSEGWWHLDARQCADVVQSPLTAQYYYLFALDFDAGGGWSGHSTLCVAPDEFTIHGRTECEAKGHHTAGFFEVDTDRRADWTVHLDPETRRPDPRKSLSRLSGQDG